MSVYVSNLLTASAAPTYGVPEPTRTWQWLRGSTAISGATSSTYTVTTDDIGETISVRQTETSFKGTASATSAATSAVLAFTPTALFQNSETGAWYEPGEGSLQLSTGEDLTEAGPGDPVGFQLDKSQGAGFSGGAFTGLGDELWVGTTVDDSAGTGTSSDVDGVITISGTDASNRGRRYLSISGLTVGQQYLITFDVTSFSGSAFGVEIDSGSPSATGSYDSYFDTTGTRSASFVYAAEATTRVITFFTGSSGATATIENVSFKEIPGNHATQATAAARPTLRQTGGGLYYLEFDGVDDGLSFTVANKTDDTFFALGTEIPASDTSGVLLYAEDDNTHFVGAYVDGNPSAPHFASGSPVCKVDGVTVSPNTRDGLHTALADGTGHFLSIETIGMVSGAWDGNTATIGDYGGFQVDGNIYAILLRDSDLTSDQYTALQTYFEGKLP